MNLFNEPSLDQLQAVVASLRDTKSNAVCVNHDGDVFGYEIQDNITWSQVQKCLRFFIQFKPGNRCTGPEAVNDEDRMFRLLLDLCVLWTERTTGRIQITRIQK